MSAPAAAVGAHTAVAVQKSAPTHELKRKVWYITDVYAVSIEFTVSEILCAQRWSGRSCRDVIKTQSSLVQGTREHQQS